MIENLLSKCDELVQPYDPDAWKNYDPLRPEEGYYYLWNERLGKIHEHYDGKTRFPSLETARFVKSCTTEWPFLIIYRHWRYSDSKTEAYNRKQEHWKILSGFVGNSKEVTCPSCGRKFYISV